MNNTNTSSFEKNISDLLRARFPILYIPSWEEERVISIIHSLAQNSTLIKTPRKVFSWSITNGMVDGKGINPEKSNSTNHNTNKATQPLDVLDLIENYSEPAIFALKDFHVFFGVPGRNPDYAVIRKIRDILPSLKQGAKPKNIIIIAPSVVIPCDLQTDITIVDFFLPSASEITAVLNQMIDVNRSTKRISFELSAEDRENLCNAALGLTLHEAENAFAKAMADGTLSINDLEVILEEKCQVVKKSEILEIVKSDLNMNDVGGLHNLKNWLQKRTQSWMESAKQYGIPAPKGVLITGVPGCGKSMIVKTISSFWQLPLLRLDIGKIFSGIVGSSEDNMRRAIKTVEAVSPAILWIDEIEKGFSGVGSSGDSGTSSRVFGTFLTWMQEKTKPVFVAATANNIHSLPPEFLRKGRFDEIFFVDLPTHQERVEIFRLHLTKRLKDSKIIGNLKLRDELFQDLASLTEGFSGAEIEQAVITGLIEAFAGKRDICAEDFLLSINNTVPLSVTQAEQICAIRDWANLRAVSATAQQDRKQYNNKSANSPDEIRLARGGRAVDF